nr:MAG TPA: hypothetical protein [Caudoviricetes sp.]
MGKIFCKSPGALSKNRFFSYKLLLIEVGL